MTIYPTVRGRLHVAQWAGVALAAVLAAVIGAGAGFVVAVLV